MHEPLLCGRGLAWVGHAPHVCWKATDSKDRPFLKHTGWFFFFCWWRSNKALHWAATRHQGKNSECRKVFIVSFIVLPREKKNEVDVITEVWYLSSVRSQTGFQWRSVIERHDYLGRKSLKLSLLHVQKPLAKRIPASFTAVRTKPGALDFKTKVNVVYIGEIPWARSTGRDCVPGPLLLCDLEWVIFFLYALVSPFAKEGLWTR